MASKARVRWVHVCDRCGHVIDLWHVAGTVTKSIPGKKGMKATSMRATLAHLSRLLVYSWKWASLGLVWQSISHSLLETLQWVWLYGPIQGAEYRVSEDNQLRHSTVLSLSTNTSSASMVVMPLISIVWFCVGNLLCWKFYERMSSVP